MKTFLMKLKKTLRSIPYENLTECFLIGNWMQTQKIGLSSVSLAESANSLNYDNQWSIGEKNFVV